MCYYKHTAFRFSQSMEYVMFLSLDLHLANAFIQSDLQVIQVIHFLSVCVIPGNWTHNLCTANAMLYHWATGTPAVWTRILTAPIHCRGSIGEQVM